MLFADGEAAARAGLHCGLGAISARVWPTRINHPPIGSRATPASARPIERLVSARMQSGLSARTHKSKVWRWGGGGARASAGAGFFFGGILFGASSYYCSYLHFVAKPLDTRRMSGTILGPPPTWGRADRLSHRRGRRIAGVRN